MAKRKEILNAALKALLAGAEVSALLKIPVTFISELASLPKETRDTLNTALSSEQFEELLTQAELSATNAALAAVGIEQIKKLVSELNKRSDGQISDLTKLIREKYNTEQKLVLEKEFKLYGELWRALVDVRRSVIITPTLDIMPKGKSPYDVYKDRVELATDAFNKANSLFNYNRPFYHEDVSKITGDLLSQCRGYIRSVDRMLRSGSFDDELHDKADELLEKVPEATNEIEEAIKRRIGLLREAEIVE
jgi:acetyl/propionyl-CoA carboxylase alpha subunit